MQFVFGPGTLIATPLSDAFGNLIAATSLTPRTLGAFQEASFDTAAENKTLYGANQYPLAVGRGKAKLTLKVKAAQVSVDKLNAMFVGQPANVTNSVLVAYSDTVGTIIPGTPYQITPVTTYASYLQGTSPAFESDLGVQDGNGNAYVRVNSAPATGQYSLAGGVYTFNSADAGKTVFISFGYTATNGAAGTTTHNAQYVIVNNIQMGQAPTMQLDLVANFGLNQLRITMYQAICSKVSFSTKLDDFAIPDLEFDGFSNSNNQAYRISAFQ